MNLNDLWIGDIVRLKQSGKIGRFEGVNEEGKVRINIGDKVLLSTSANLEIVDDAEISAIPEQKTQNKGPKKQAIPPKVIDLHIEALDPSLKNQLPQMILNKQITACRAFIEKSIIYHQPEIEIIHGKGAGQLKREVEHILSSYPEVLSSHTIHDGGATQVFLKYQTYR